MDFIGLVKEQEIPLQYSFLWVSIQESSLQQVTNKVITSDNTQLLMSIWIKSTY